MLHAVILAVRLETSAVQMLLQQNAEIKEELRMIKVTLQELARRQRGIDATKNGLLPSNVSLPLKTVAEVDRLEQQLRSHEIYSQIVCSVCSHFLICIALSQ